MQGNLLDRLRDFWSIGEDHGWDPECVIAELCESIEGDNVNSAKPGAAIAVFVNTFAKELKNRYSCSFKYFLTSRCNTFVYHLLRCISIGDETDVWRKCSDKKKNTMLKKRR